MYFLAIFPVLIILVLVGYTVEVSTGPSDFNFEWKALVVLSGLWGVGHAVRVFLGSNSSGMPHDLSRCSCGYPLESIREKVGACPECGRAFSYEQIVWIHVLSKRESSARPPKDQAK